MALEGKLNLIHVVILISSFAVFSASGQVCDFCLSSSATCFLRQADVAILFQTSSFTNTTLFERSRSFAGDLLNTFSLGQCGVRAAFVRSTGEEVETIFNFNTTTDNDFVFTYVNGFPQGQGVTSDLASNLDYVRQNTFTQDSGSRSGVVKILVVITDNLPSQTSDVARASAAIRNDSIVVFAIGIGEEVEPSALVDITGNSERNFLFVDLRAFTRPMERIVQSAVCYDDDECIINNGGCSDVCRNTQGSFECLCRNDTILSSDRRTCVAVPVEGSDMENSTVEMTINPEVDLCQYDNGGCCQMCSSFMGSRNCSCYDGFALNADETSCSDINECINSPCSHSCINTIGSFCCECPEEYELASDGLTCVLRPGPADCPKNFKVVSHSCMRSTNALFSFGQAEASCNSMNNSRLAKVSDDGTRALVSRFFSGKTWIGLQKVGTQWLNSDGTVFQYEWAYGNPDVGNCGFVQNLIFSASCNNQYKGACEIPRTKGFMIFGSQWSHGAQGKLYMPTGINEVLVTFPKSIARFQVWYGSLLTRLNARQYVVTQNDIQRLSNNGHVGFLITYRLFRFPDYKVMVEPYVGKEE